MITTPPRELAGRHPCSGHDASDSVRTDGSWPIFRRRRRPRGRASCGGATVAACLGVEREQRCASGDRTGEGGAGQHHRRRSSSRSHPLHQAGTVQGVGWIYRGCVQARRATRAVGQREEQELSAAVGLLAVSAATHRVPPPPARAGHLRGQGTKCRPPRGTNRPDRVQRGPANCGDRRRTRRPRCSPADGSCGASRGVVPGGG